MPVTRGIGWVEERPGQATDSNLSRRRLNESPQFNACGTKLTRINRAPIADAVIAHIVIAEMLGGMAPLLRR